MEDWGCCSCFFSGRGGVRGPRGRLPRLRAPNRPAVPRGAPRRPAPPCPPLPLPQVCLLLVLLGGADGFGGLKTLSNENAFLNTPTGGLGAWDRTDSAAGAYEMPARKRVEKKACVLTTFPQF